MACLIDCSWHVVDYRLAGVRSVNGLGMIDVDLFGLHALTIDSFCALVTHCAFIQSHSQVSITGFFCALVQSYIQSHTQ